MNPITVSIDISRAAAILAGKTHYGPTIVTVDPSKLTPEQREELAGLPVISRGSDAGALDLRAAHGMMPGYTTPIVQATQDTIARALDEHRAARLAHKAKQEADSAREAQEQQGHAARTAREFIDRPASGRITMCGNNSWRVATPGLAKSLLSPELLAAYEAAKQEAQILADDRTAKDKARDEAERAKMKAIEAKKAQGLADFVRDHGSPLQQKRREAGLMPDDEVLNMVRERLFKPLDHMDRYKRMKASHFPKADRVTFETTDADRATDEQFAIMEAIREMIPGATVTLREHKAELHCYEDDNETIAAYSFLVEIDWNGWNLSREYRA